MFYQLYNENNSNKYIKINKYCNNIGPSFNMDGGWICSSEALKKAKTMIENGFITSALVGVTNLCLRPELQYQFQGLNRLNQGVHTKPFSVNGKYKLYKNVINFNLLLIYASYFLRFPSVIDYFNFSCLNRI